MKFKLGRILRKRDITQAEFARLTKIRPSTINAYYHGFAKRLNVKDLKKMCNVLNCKLSDIIEYEPPKK